MEKLVIALGGNALQEGNSPATASATRSWKKRPSILRTSSKKAIGSFLRTATAWVGRIVLQNEHSVNVTPAMPFDVCGAMSQGMIGYHMQQGLTKALRALANRRLAYRGHAGCRRQKRQGVPCPQQAHRSFL